MSKPRYKVVPWTLAEGNSRYPAGSQGYAVKDTRDLDKELQWWEYESDAFLDARHKNAGIKPRYVLERQSPKTS